LGRVTKWKRITAQTTANTRVEIQVVVMNFFLSLGSTGAPGSPPSPLSRPASAWVWVPSGRMANSRVHQMV